MHTLHNTLFFGKVFIEQENIDSTNIYAQQLIRESKPPEGTVIFADNQTQGRGHYGSKWHSEAGKNIALSIILYPKFLDIQDQFYLNIAVSLGVFDALELYIPSQLSVKWPNDIYYLNHKIAGILIENSISNNKISSSVVGVGININQTAFPDELPNPSSLSAISGKEYNIKEVLQQLLEKMEKRYLELRSGKKELLRNEYLKKLFRKNKITHFRQGTREFFAIVEDIAPDGKLILKEEEQRNAYNFKEIEWILPPTKK